MMTYKTQVRSVWNKSTHKETFYQQRMGGAGRPYWERVSRVWYQELRSKADRTNLISEHDAINNRSVTRELFFEVSPV